MSVKRPKRRNYDSEPDFLMACLRYLDAKFPGREGQRKRIAAWARWEREHDPEAILPRIRELLRCDDLTPSEDAELDRLMDAWKTLRRNARPTRKATP